LVRKAPGAAGSTSGEKPRCRQSQRKVDLADAAARSGVLDAALRGALKALVLLEGLLGCRDEEVVASLGRDRSAAWRIRVVSAFRIASERTNRAAGVLTATKAAISIASRSGFC
jgi:hypothetical protein